MAIVCLYVQVHVSVCDGSSHRVRDGAVAHAVARGACGAGDDDPDEPDRGIEAFVDESVVGSWFALRSGCTK